MPHTISSRNSVARSRTGTRIFRRTDKGSWTYKSQVKGQQKYWPLGLNRKKALELADQIRAHLIIHPYYEVLEMFNKKKFSLDKGSSPTIAQVENILKENRISSGLTQKSIKSYLDNFKRFARVLSNSKDVDNFDLGQINDSAFRRFKTKSLSGIKDQALIASKKRTVNTIIRSMKAIFTRTSIYEGYNMEFVECIRSQEFYRGLKKVYRLPPLEIIQKTFDLLAKSDGDVHTLIGLALHFGLRRNEIFHIRRSWFDFDCDDHRARIYVAADKKFKPKGGHEGFTMGGKAFAKSILNKATGDDLLINNRADNGRPTFEKALRELRAIGWERSNPLHELRKLFGSYIASTESIYISQKFLRHADASTTNDSYADAIIDDKIKNLWVA